MHASCYMCMQFQCTLMDRGVVCGVQFAVTLQSIGIGIVYQKYSHGAQKAKAVFNSERAVICRAQPGMPSLALPFALPCLELS